jgi:ribose/xylose/arabinose/galactoside ABC-type transport system permease subunit
MAEVTERRKRGTARDIARRVIRHENATLGIMLAAIIGALALATGGKSIRISNMKMVVVEGATMGIGAIGQMFVLLTGGIDLSVAGMAFGTSALGSAMMTTQLWQNILVKNSILGYTEAASIWVGVPAILAMGVGLGLISGLFVSRIGIPPFIATLGMWQIAHGIGFLITGGFTIVRMVDPLRFFGQRFIYGFPVAGIIWIVVGVVVYFVLHHLNYGRAVYASGGNPIMAWLSGINVKATQLSVYMISGFMAALGGLIRTGRVMSVSYSSFDFLELQTIASAVIGGVSLFGGKGTVIGVVLGALVISVVLNGMTILRADPFLESLILGVIVIAAVAVDYWRGR